jgi:hypothetical protein
LTHEELVLKPAATMRALYCWLGVDPSVVEMSDFGEPENVTPDIVGVRKYGALSRQVLQALPLASITPHIPQPLRITLRRLTRKDVARRRVDTTELIKFLRPIQMQQTERLAHLLGRAFPEWTTLYEPAARTHRAMEFSDYIAP